ncbi:DJ-1 family glyoxalase III [Candidatus Magnetomonas plexicatena]|uniref:DJ-1 family glyoxalase III n=1 Tax=Candidatus Magnetomonas plexicatena TaxID=2552947 RepID=UPI0011045667|nr:DJ-1/PfpI family protein [Nitrospirales bacterium LBB_01]
MASVLVILAEGFEEIEAIAVIDILRRAEINTVVAGLKEGFITSARGVKVIPDCTLDSVSAVNFDMVVLPGGMPGTLNLAADTRVKSLVASMYNDGKYTAAICAAPFVLSEAGVLSGKTATSHPSYHDKIKAATVSKTERVVVDGKVVTSQGAGTAIEFSLKIVELFCGKERADSIHAAMVCS